MTSRIATDQDIPHITRLLSEMREKTIDKSIIRSQYLDTFNSPARSVMLILDDGATPVGMAVLNLVYKLPKIECRLDEVIVSPSVRGQGYGKHLVEACEHWAWDHGADTFDFTSRPSREAANHLYQKLGYRLRETNVYTKDRP